ncbi:MAG: hypothetical protein LC789_11200, partial [Actinobacteria bacterium]|nr:hypothetical protein [Actinomycetota bacterium]
LKEDEDASYAAGLAYACIDEGVPMPAWRTVELLALAGREFAWYFARDDDLTVRLSMRRREQLGEAFDGLAADDAADPYLASVVTNCASVLQRCTNDALRSELHDLLDPSGWVDLVELQSQILNLCAELDPLEHLLDDEAADDTRALRQGLLDAYYALD